MASSSENHLLEARKEGEILNTQQEVSVIKVNLDSIGTIMTDIDSSSTQTDTPSSLASATTEHSTPTELKNFKQFPLEIKEMIWGYWLPESNGLTYVFSPGRQSKLLQGQWWESECQLEIVEDVVGNSDHLGFTLYDQPNYRDIKALMAVDRESYFFYVKKLPYVASVWSRSYASNHMQRPGPPGRVHYRMRFGAADAVHLHRVYHLMGLQRGGTTLPAPVWRNINPKHWIANITKVSFPLSMMINYNGPQWRRSLEKMQGLKVIEITTSDEVSLATDQEFTAAFAEASVRFKERYGVKMVWAGRRIEGYAAVWPQW